MHPAYSVIFFTTATGAGYGLLALLGIAAALGVLPPDFWLGFIGMGLALALVSAGLLSSTAHLGRPERAWWAFSQWRTSWLSREGVASVLTYIPAGLFGIGWVFLGTFAGWVSIAAILAAIGSVATVCTTAMIYASLKPVAEWHSRFTLPAYLVFSAMTGCALFNALLAGFGLGEHTLTISALLLTLGGWALKEAVWRHNGRLGMPATANSATGLAGGTVRSVEWPHTEKNYLLKEMGYRVARKHAHRLRSIVRILGFLVPAALLAVSALTPSPIAVALALIAPLPQLTGMLIERWLFFAEARHTVALYYGL